VAPALTELRSGLSTAAWLRSALPAYLLFLYIIFIDNYVNLKRPVGANTHKRHPHRRSACNASDKKKAQLWIVFVTGM